jgi:hypothetical protein
VPAKTTNTGCPVLRTDCFIKNLMYLIYFCGVRAMKTSVKNENQSISLLNAQKKIPSRDAWNEGKLLVQKPPLKLK